MKIACLTFNPIQENTYVVWDDTKECAVIDAGNSTPKEDAALDGFLAEHGLKPVLAVNTHGHSFHRLPVFFLHDMKNTGKADFLRIVGQVDYPVDIICNPFENS